MSVRSFHLSALLFHTTFLFSYAAEFVFKGGSGDSIVEAFDHKGYVTSLEVEDISLSQSHFESILKAIKPKEITSLTLKNVGLTNRHLEQLADELKGSKNLKKLSLKFNKFDDVSPLGRLAASSDIEKINLSHNDVTNDKGLLLLVDALSPTNKLRRLIIKNPTSIEKNFISLLVHAAKSCLEGFNLNNFAFKYGNFNAIGWDRSHISFIRSPSLWEIRLLDHVWGRAPYQLLDHTGRLGLYVVGGFMFYEREDLKEEPYFHLRVEKKGDTFHHINHHIYNFTFLSTSLGCKVDLKPDMFICKTFYNWILEDQNLKKLDIVAFIKSGKKNFDNGFTFDIPTLFNYINRLDLDREELVSWMTFYNIIKDRASNSVLYGSWYKKEMEKKAHQVLLGCHQDKKKKDKENERLHNRITVLEHIEERFNELTTTSASTIRDLQQKMDGVEKELQDLRGQFQGKQGESEEFARQLAAVQQEYQQVQEKCVQYKQKLTQKKLNYDEILKQLKESQEGLESLTSEKASSEQQLEARIVQQQRTYENRIELLEEENQILTRRISALQKEINRLNKELDKKLDAQWDKS